jgi:hypothetical protein
MTLKQIAGLGQKLIVFLKMFSDCFGRREPRRIVAGLSQRPVVEPAAQKH